MFAPGLVRMFSGPLDAARDLSRLCAAQINEKFLEVDELKLALFAGYKDYVKILKKQQRSWPDAELLVCGFRRSGPLILHIANGGVYEVVHPKVGVIGIGAFYADPLIRWRMLNEPLDPFSNLHDVVYRVYEAKRFAETSKDVGRVTSIEVMRPGEDAESYFEQHMVPHEWQNFLEEQYQKFGPQKLPEQRDHFVDLPKVIGDASGHGRSNP
jgi:hypothetical protein